MLEILATGATAEEVALAIAWVKSDEPLINRRRILPVGRVGLLIQILQPSDEDGEARAH